MNKVSYSMVTVIFFGADPVDGKTIKQKLMAKP